MKRPAEAEVQIRRALERDPLNEQIQALFSRDLVHARTFDEAVRQFQKVLQTNPDSPPAAEQSRRGNLHPETLRRGVHLFLTRYL